MKGVQIFTHSLRQVMNNLPAAIRISGILYLVQTIVAFAVGGALMSGDMGMIAGGGFGLSMIVVLVVSLITGIWIAVAWHRYVLLGEDPNAVVPPFDGDRMRRYFVKSLLIAIVLIVIGVILGTLVGLLAMPLMMEGATSLALLIVALFVQVPMLFLGLRMMAALPGAALGVDHPMMAGWEATTGEWKPLLVLALILAVLISVLNLIGVFVFGDTMLLAQIWQVITGWPIMMVGLSVLTTLYGHYVEKRPLV